MRFSPRFRVLGAVVLALALTVGILSVGAGAPPERVRVWVSYQAGAHDTVHQALQGAGAQFHYDFQRLNAYVVTVPEKALQGLRNNPNVVSIEEDVPRYLYGSAMSTQAVQAAVAAADTGQTVPYGVDMVQARDVWDADRDGVVDSGAPTGSGITVCIIDTGLYTDHEDFAGVDIIGGYSQVGDPWDTDGAGHGTHVAGTIAAANNSLGVVGVTPGAVSLYIVKIFDNDGLWTMSSDLVDAIYRCADAGANVVSMSLGGSRSTGKESQAFADLYNQGVLFVAAAGNDGTTAYSYPASYDSVISVAAIDSTETVADFSQQNDQVELAAPGVDVLSTIPWIEENHVTVDGVTYDANHIEYAARGSVSGPLVDGGLCDSTGDWQDAVVLCERGDITFYEKVMNVQNSGGVAALIYNNEPGNFYGTLGDGNSSDIIALSLTQEDGQYLVANKLGETADVYSSITQPASGYEAWSGTSMATPHVSAVAALVWSAFPSLTNADIRAALDATAKDLGEEGRDVAYGYGLVQAYDAIQYLSGTDNGGDDGDDGDTGDEGALSVTVATDKDTYTNRETVNITVNVTDGTDPVADASVAMTITTASGRTVSATATTDANGQATFSYWINANRDGVGTYTVDVTATKSGYTSGSASTTFVVE
ncbi:MAG: S8 family serine peptidase [Chloroflexi bacterium]|nr:S8 family serine peptidase [Chloroflexota bacterium]